MTDYRRCVSCRMRERVDPTAAREFYNPVHLAPSTLSWIENAARVFDEESGEKFSAAEFVAWMRPDLGEGS